MDNRSSEIAELSKVAEHLVSAAKVVEDYKARMIRLRNECETLRRENARLEEQERDMMRASTVVRALNENSRLREETCLLKKSLALRSASASGNKMQPVQAEPEADAAPEESSEEEDDFSFTEITYKKRHYCMDANGNVFDREVCASYEYDESAIAKHATVAGKYTYDTKGKLRITLA